MPEKQPGSAAPSSDELRTFLAGQRTLLAWIRTALALMGFGFLVARFGLFLRQVLAVEHLPTTTSSSFSLWMGMALVLLGVAVNVCAATRHLEFLRNFRTSQLGQPRRSLFEVALALLLAALGIIMAVYLLIVEL